MFLLENSLGKQRKIIIYYGGMQSRILQSTILLQNIKVFLCYNLLKQSHTAIWNGKRVVVYEVAGDKSMVRAEGKTENLPKNTSLTV